MQIPDIRVLTLLVDLLRAGRQGSPVVDFEHPRTYPAGPHGEPSEHAGADLPDPPPHVGVTVPPPGEAAALLREFEEETGLHLVTRTRERMTLTERGIIMASWAEAVVDGLDRFANGTAALSQVNEGDDGEPSHPADGWASGAVGGAGGPHRPLSVCASLTIAEFLLPVWLDRFRIAHPEVRVRLDVVGSDAVAETLRAGGADLGLIESPDTPEGVSSSVVGYDALVVAVGPTHPWAGRRTPLSGSELVSAPLLVREQGSGTRAAVEAALAPWGGPTVAAEHPSNAAIRMAAKAGAAPAVLSRLAMRESVDSGALVEVPHESEVRLTRPLRALWPSGTGLRGHADDLLRLIRSQA